MKQTQQANHFSQYQTWTTPASEALETSMPVELNQTQDLRERSVDYSSPTKRRRLGNLDKQHLITSSEYRA